MFCHSIAVACVTIHTHTLPVLTSHLVTIFAGTEISIFMLEFSVHTDDGHGVGGIAVVAPYRSVSSFTHAVTNLCQMELVQKVFVETRVFVDCVVLDVTVILYLRCPVVELDLIGSICETIALLDLQLNLFGSCRQSLRYSLIS